VSDDEQVVVVVVVVVVRVAVVVVPASLFSLDWFTLLSILLGALLSFDE
jgi:hypothetical protein